MEGNMLLLRYWHKVIQYVRLIISFKKPIYITYWAPYLSDRKAHKNIGDDLNVPLIESISKCHVFPVQLSKDSSYRSCFAVIGSIIPWLINRDTSIWGAGVEDCSPDFYVYPRRIYAVRGPLTREILMEKGIECPAVYGDPALLLPLVYYPNLSKKFKYGIILHEKDYENVRLLSNIKKMFSQDVVLIDISKYSSWKNVINNIVQCEHIVSSSLHGLILSDAYRIPSTWAQFTYDFGTGYVKFWDYFLSVGRNDEKRVLFTDISQILTCKEHKRIGKINIQPLISSCPFRNDLLERYNKFILKNKGKDIVYYI